MSRCNEWVRPQLRDAIDELARRLERFGFDRQDVMDEIIYTGLAPVRGKAARLEAEAAKKEEERDPEKPRV